jgi:hypothetical protein
MQPQTAQLNKKSPRKAFGLWLVIGPTALMIVALLLYVIINFFFGGSGTILRTIFNVLLFLIGLIVVISWLPGMIVGIILLATDKKK